MKNTLHAVAMITCTTLVTAPAFAGDLNINGFLSVGASMLDKKNDASIEGADATGGFKNDTILGLQVSKQVNESTTATGQLVSRGTEDYSTEAAWAFITYAANEDVDIRMGRLRIPFFQYSDFLEVGYAYNWVRTPSEVYRLPFSSIDGVDFTHRFSNGNLDGAVQLYYGRFEGTLDLGGNEQYESDYRNFTGIAFSANMGDFGTRLSYHQAELSMDTSTAGTNLNNAGTVATSISLIPQGIDAGLINPALAGFTGVGDASAAEDFNFTGQTSQFFGAALTYDNGTYSAVAEWTALNHETSLFLDDQAWLISVATRAGDFTPHLTYSAQKSDFDSGNEGNIQKQLKLEYEQNSIIAGVRYDYDAGTALKFEIQHNDEVTMLGADGDSATLYSVAVDIVF